MNRLTRRQFGGLAAASAAGALVPTFARAETRNLTIASSHALTVPWVGVMSEFVQPEMNARLAAAGSDLVIDWTEAYGGVLYSFQDTLEAVQTGLTDIGWVGTLWEEAKMPLHQITYNTPFVADDFFAIMSIMNALHDTQPALNAAWAAQNQVFLGAQGHESYHLMTTAPVEGLLDLAGRKILAPGPTARWLQGTGAVAVDGALTTYYTQIQQGVADGVIIPVSGAFPFKIHEVAPHLTLVGMGAPCSGAMTINADTWAALPPDAQTILGTLGREYTVRVNEQVQDRYDRFIVAMQDEGLLVTTLPAEEKAAWAAALPDIAGAWVRAAEAEGQPARALLLSYMDEIRSRVGPPIRAWDKQL